MTRTPTILNPNAVKVSPKTGESLHFILNAVGPIPIFSFASSVAGNLFQATDFPGHPLATYEWDHLKNPSDVQQLELLNLALSFLTSSGYTYTVELRDATNAVVSTVMKIGYTGAPTEVTNESFTVIIV